jgi:hypothetical protein
MLIEKKNAKYWNLKMHRAVEKSWRTLLQPANGFLMQPPPLYHDQPQLRGWRSISILVLERNASLPRHMSRYSYFGPFVHVLVSPDKPCYPIREPEATTSWLCNEAEFRYPSSCGVGSHLEHTTSNRSWARGCGGCRNIG